MPTADHDAWLAALIAEARASLGKMGRMRLAELEERRAPPTPRRVASPLASAAAGADNRSRRGPTRAGESEE